MSKTSNHAKLVCLRPFIIAAIAKSSKPKVQNPIVTEVTREEILKIVNPQLYEKLYRRPSPRYSGYTNSPAS